MVQKYKAFNTKKTVNVRDNLIKSHNDGDKSTLGNDWTAKWGFYSLSRNDILDMITSNGQ